MQYLERTLQVRSALLERPDLQATIRNIFASHVEKDGKYEPIGRGNSRWAYEVGQCEMAAGVTINLLLKLKTSPLRLKYSHASKRSQSSDLAEFGAFEVYYDFVAGHLESISFRTKAGFNRYKQETILGRTIPFTFALSDRWGGTRVERGDLGAIPYFQIAVRHKGLFGHLTEGEPPHIEPKYTAEDRGTMDDYTVESGRIIDIGGTQSLLVDADQGGHIKHGERYPNNLGLWNRGAKYFRPDYRLDL
jgi:hypothetical protein